MTVLLWARTTDPVDVVRQEGIAGLARRRDRRAAPLVSAYLGRDDPPECMFDAATFLADPTLMPLLTAVNDRAATALLECDPQRRRIRGEQAIAVLAQLDHLLPGAAVALYAERFDPGDLILQVSASDGVTPTWSVSGLLDRADGDVQTAVRLAFEDLVSGQDR